jgi:hypothetical protein
MRLREMRLISLHAGIDRIWNSPNARPAYRLDRVLERDHLEGDAAEAASLQESQPRANATTRDARCERRRLDEWTTDNDPHGEHDFGNPVLTMPLAAGAHPVTPFHQPFQQK